MLKRRPCQDCGRQVRLSSKIQHPQCPACRLPYLPATEISGPVIPAVYRFRQVHQDLAKFLDNLHNDIISESPFIRLTPHWWVLRYANSTGKVFLQPTGSFRGLRWAIIELQLLIAEESWASSAQWAYLHQDRRCWSLLSGNYPHFLVRCVVEMENIVASFGFFRMMPHSIEIFMRYHTSALIDKLFPPRSFRLPSQDRFSPYIRTLFFANILLPQNCLSSPSIRALHRFLY